MQKKSLDLEKIVQDKYLIESLNNSEIMDHSKKLKTQTNTINHNQNTL